VKAIHEAVPASTHASSNSCRKIPPRNALVDGRACLQCITHSSRGGHLVQAEVYGGDRLQNQTTEPVHVRDLVVPTRGGLNKAQQALRLGPSRWEGVTKQCSKSRTASCPSRREAKLHLSCCDLLPLCADLPSVGHPWWCHPATFKRLPIQVSKIHVLLDLQSSTPA